MAENLHLVDSEDKKERYDSLVPQIKALIAGETDVIANLANIAAALKFGMNFFWVGFYLVKENELILGPFQGPIACTRIAMGKGVCGTAWAEKRIVTVENVEKFPGHIACSTDSKSEIVLPVMKDGKVVMILDVDSNKLSDFDEVDEHALQQIIKMIEQKL